MKHGNFDTIAVRTVCHRAELAFLKCYAGRHAAESIQRLSLTSSARITPIDAIFDNTDLDYATIRGWFSSASATGYTRLDVPAEHAATLASLLGICVRRCYLSDHSLSSLLSDPERNVTELIAACLPDRGATMAGDFGEMLTFIYHLANNEQLPLHGPKKWRLKIDRRKPSPMSDVIHFALPTWPIASDSDQLMCSEVKVKSTNGSSLPISSALEDSQKDRASRLAKTLTWLRERAILGDDLDVDREQLDRFIKVAENPVYSKEFNAVAVICSGLIEDELSADPPATDPHHPLVVIGVPELKNTYQQVFDAAALAGLPGGVE